MTAPLHVCLNYCQTCKAEVERMRVVLTALVDDSEGQQHRVAWQDACELLHGHRGPEAGKH